MAVGPVFGRTCAMSGKAVWNENLGSALMTGEFVRFNKNFVEEGKNAGPRPLLHAPYPTLT